MKQKQTFQNQISDIKDDTKREILDLQILVRTLKLEKIDLFMQNNVIKQEAEDAKKESIRKDHIISQMQAEIDLMKHKIRREKSMNSLYNETLTPVYEKIDNDDPLLSSFKEIPHHRPHNSLKQARDLKKTVGLAKNLDSKTVNFLKDYAPAIKNDEETLEIDKEIDEEEGKINTPMVTKGKLRPFSMDGNNEGKSGKKGSFSGFQISFRAESVKKLRKFRKNKPKFVEISMESVLKKRPVLEKKDVNIPHRNESYKKGIK